jgi:hypothetical protein
MGVFIFLATPFLTKGLKIRVSPISNELKLITLTL